MTPRPSPDSTRPPPLPPWAARPGAGELVVAVDTGNFDDALRLRDRLAGAADFFKIGKELFTAAGPAAVAAFTEAGRVFLDLKFHDIPATVAGAVRSAAALGASLVDVHASGGRPMIQAAASVLRGEGETPSPHPSPGASRRSAPAAGFSPPTAIRNPAASPRDSDPGSAPDSAPAPERPLLLAVTVLTHLDPPAAAEVFPGTTIADQVLRLAALSQASGADGVVASAEEAPLLREKLGDDPVLLVPGVRPSWAAATHDQRRVATPAEAARRGANYLVVGRAITRSDDPAAAALRIREETASVPR